MVVVCAAVGKSSSSIVGSSDNGKQCAVGSRHGGSRSGGQCEAGGAGTEGNVQEGRQAWQHYSIGASISSSSVSTAISILSSRAPRPLCPTPSAGAAAVAAGSGGLDVFLASQL